VDSAAPTDPKSSEASTDGDAAKTVPPTPPVADENASK
jgi:hypothetical protein